MIWRIKKIEHLTEFKVILYHKCDKIKKCDQKLIEMELWKYITITKLINESYFCIK